MSLPTKAITTPRTSETHAYRIPHVGVTNTMQICKSVVAATDNASSKNDALIAAEERSISAIYRKCEKNGSNFGSSYDSKEISSDVRDEEPLDDQRKAKNYNRQQAIIGNNKFLTLSNVDHVYEEVRTIKEPRGNSYEYDIRDYYEKYSPTTAKTLIETLFLSRHAICKECAKMKGSPVYTDRLIYTKEPLFAIEVALCQCGDDVSCFKYSHEDTEENTFHSQYRSQNFMLVYSYTKTNAASILCPQYRSRDVFDLQPLLKPSINVVNRARCKLVVNTQLYHRYINSYHMRTSRAGCIPKTFYHDRGNEISCTKRINYNDSQDPSIYQKRPLKDSYSNGHQDNRSSLLLLEPLLLMPESNSPRHQEENIKKHMSRSERTKISRIIMAYALSFFILASITFYIVYFT